MGLQRQAPGTLPPGRALLLSAATTATVVAWGVLVFAAIDFGRSARSGDTGDWVFLALSTLGAVACMFLAIVLAARIQSTIRVSARSSTRPLPRSLQHSADEAAPDTTPGPTPEVDPDRPRPPRPGRPGGKRAVRR